MEFLKINFRDTSILWLSVGLFGLTGTVFSQPMTGTLRMPELENPQKLEITISDQATAKQIVWIVYSDRDENVLYYDSACDSAIQTGINFLDKFFVVDETETMVSVVSAEPFSKLKGWIPKSKLILLDHAILDQGNQAAAKVMIINKISSVIWGEGSSVPSDKFRFSKNPDKFLFDSNSVIAKSIDFYYILKEYNGKMLLSSASEIWDPDRIHSTVMGWLDKDLTVKWNSMAVLQPNYQITGRSPARIAETEEIARGWINGENGPAIWREDSVSDQPWPPSRMRCLYLGPGKNPDVIRVGVFQDIDLIHGQQIQTMLNHLREWERQDRGKNNLNLVFVIDGSASMRKYFPVIADAISQSYHQISRNPDFSDPDNPKRVVVKLGAVVYRDGSDCPYLAETCPLQDFNNTRKWISDNFQDIKDCQDKDIPNAVFFGLFMALEDVLAGHENDNNLIILIGDAGDSQRHDNSFIDIKDIVNGMAKFNCQFIAYQTQWKDPAINPENLSYTEFSGQAMEIALESARLIHKELPAIRPRDLQKEVSLIRAESTDRYDLYILDPPFLANKVYVNKGCGADAVSLTDFIMETILTSSKEASLVNTFIRQILYRGWSWEDVIYDIPTEKLANMNAITTTLGYLSGELEKKYPGEDVNAPGGRLEQLLQGKPQQFFIEGYSPLKVDGSTYDQWLFEILTPANTKKKLERDYVKIINSYKSQGSAEQARQLIYDAVHTLSQTYSGSPVSCEDIPLSELFPTIINCPGLKTTIRYRPWLSKTLKQILMEGECDHECLEILYHEIFRSYNKISRLSYKDYVTTVFGKYSAYFIPVEFMPFVE